MHSICKFSSAAIAALLYTIPAIAQYPSLKSTENIRVNGNTYIYSNPFYGGSYGNSGNSSQGTSRSSNTGNYIYQNSKKTGLDYTPPPGTPPYERVIRDLSLLLDSAKRTLRADSIEIARWYEQENYPAALRQVKTYHNAYYHAANRYEDLNKHYLTFKSFYDTLPINEAAFLVPELVSLTETGAYLEAIENYKLSWMVYKAGRKISFTDKKASAFDLGYWAFEPSYKAETMSAQSLNAVLRADMALVKAMILTGDAERAIQLQERTLEKAQSSKHDLGKIKSHAGLNYCFAGLYDKGLPLLEEGLAADPTKKEARIATLLGQLKKSSKPLDPAVKDFLARHTTAERSATNAQKQLTENDLDHLELTGKYSDGVAYFEQLYTSKKDSDSAFYCIDSKRIDRWLKFCLLAKDETRALAVIQTAETVARQTVAGHIKYRNELTEKYFPASRKVPEHIQESMNRDEYYSQLLDRQMVVDAILMPALFETNSYNLIRKLMEPYKAQFESYTREEAGTNNFSMHRDKMLFNEKLNRLKTDAGVKLQYARKRKYS